MAKVFLGVGHGGKDPGAIGNGFEEADLNLAIALACQAELVRHGVIVGMSRTKDENDDLVEEINECNAFGADLALDIHNNAGGGDGAEAYHHHGGGVGKTLAENILGEIVKIGQNSRGAKIRKNANGDDYYGFIRQTNCPAVIVETAFVDNAKDIQIIDTEAEQKAMGVALAKGILKTLNIAYKEEKKTLYRVQVGAFYNRDYAEDYMKKLKRDGYDGFIVTA
jgi:N-acetylmuramoyl-L-alanine amidase